MAFRFQFIEHVLREALFDTHLVGQPLMMQPWRIDGGGELYLYSRIAVQLSVPILVTVGIVTFLSVYNDYLWPAIVLKEQHRTFTMAAVSLNTAGRQDIGLSFAGYVIGSVPTVAVILLGMKYYIDGMVAGAVKA